MIRKAKLCSIEGCDKHSRARGWCFAHWVRWRRHGSPYGGGTSWGEPDRFLREVVLGYDGTDCIFWPYNKNNNGYAMISRDGCPVVVNRIVCQQARGEPPTPDHEAAHSCGRGGQGCVTKRHLSWKTHAENMADTLIHGTHNRGERCGTSKLTEDQVREIRALNGVQSNRSIAKQFEVSRSAIDNIQLRKQWSWLQ